MKPKEYWSGEIQEPSNNLTSFEAVAEAIQDDARADLLDRIKVLEGELESTGQLLNQTIARVPTTAQAMVYQSLLMKYKNLESLLHRIPLGLLRVEEHRQLYLDMCAALNIEPWVEK